MNDSYYYLVGRHEDRTGPPLSARAYHRAESEEEPQARIRKGDRVKIRDQAAVGTLKRLYGREGIAIRSDHGRVEILYRGRHMHTRTLAPAWAVEKLPDGPLEA